jgi:hypothetical protein
MTDAEVDIWRKKIRVIAARYVSQWAWRWNTKQMVDDIEAVGWIALLEKGNNKRSHWEIQNYIQDAICKWLYGVGRGKKPRKFEPVEPSHIDKVPQGIDPLERLIALETWSAMPQKDRDKLERHVWPAKQSGPSQSYVDQKVTNEKRRIRREKWRVKKANQRLRRSPSDV